MEVWKDIKEYEGLYKVSNYGRVYSVRKDIMLTGYDNGRGYLIVHLYKDKKMKNMYLHRLVAEAFIPKNEWETVVNHKDYDRKNCHAYNLEWCTPHYNNMYSMKNRRRFKKSSTNTGEQYIYWRQSRRTYRVNIRGVEKTFKKFGDAVEYRNKVLEELMENEAISTG